ncbi:MAG: putative glutathione S-transferase-related transrane protein [Rickettsiaceae bacterium]|jgi:uncharacterized protein YndB with AHSA1/START domain|nr:putative glutathione S-transferase-related transrane protein [Rickettsiaceae bacterium]
MTKSNHKFDHKLDLMLERIVDVPKEFIWKGWTVPEILKKWFCPLPWKTVECEIDLRPGGIFRTVMQGPQGEKINELGCFLEVVENEKLVWTNAIGPDYRPIDLVSCSNFPMTGIILLEPHEKGIKYTAIAIHKNEDDRKKHEEMGFHEGWNAAFDQLIDLYKQQK